MRHKKLFLMLALLMATVQGVWANGVTTDDINIVCAPHTSPSPSQVQRWTSAATSAVVRDAASASILVG